MKTNSQTRTHHKTWALQAVKENRAHSFIVNPFVLVNLLDDLTELYREKQALRKEANQLRKRLERIKAATGV